MADNGWDPQARYLQLDERVTNVRTSLTNLEGKVDRGFTEVHSHISANIQALTSQLTTFSGELRSGQKTQWPVILTLLGLIVTVLLGFGGAMGYAVLAPLKEAVGTNVANVNDLNSALTQLVTGLPESFIPRRETERLSARALEDRMRVEEVLKTMIPRSEVELLRQSSASDRERLWNDLGILRDQTVSRNEWMERNRARDTEVADLSRRVDEIRESLGSQYTTRDLLLSTQQELKDLRNRLEQLPAYQLPRRP